MNKPIRVVLADDHALVLEGLRNLLMVESDITVLATTTDGERLLEAVARFQPDVVITDIQMPYLNGLDSLKKIRESSPETRVLLLTAYTDSATLQSAVEARSDGLLLKTAPPEQAAHAIRQVMAGQLVFPTAARRWLFNSQREQPAITLSHRELEVLTLVAQGLTNAQVAARLQISQNTVKFHLQNIYQQLGVSNRTEATFWYTQNH
jgi:DNA-binding NarL/FixJ family response regulator